MANGYDTEFVGGRSGETGKRGLTIAPAEFSLWARAQETETASADRAESENIHIGLISDPPSQISRLAVPEGSNNNLIATGRALFNALLPDNSDQARESLLSREEDNTSGMALVSCLRPATHPCSADSRRFNLLTINPRTLK
jgi:hypothetical protein